MLEHRRLGLLAILPLSMTLVFGMQPVQSQVIYRSTTVEPNRDYDYPHGDRQVWGTTTGTTIRDSRIQNSTLVRPTVINSEIENSTLINPVILSPRSNRVVQQNQVVQQEVMPAPRSRRSGCMLFSEIRIACQ